MMIKEKKAGLIAGISLLVMAMAAGFAYGFVYKQFANELPETIKQTLLGQKPLFIAGLAAWVLIFVTDLVVSGGLYYFFSKSNQLISALTAVVRIVYTLVLGLAIIQLIGILPLLQGNVTSHAIRDHFASFEEIWSAGLIIFGFHLLGLGYLSWKSRLVPAFLAYLLYLAGICYVLVHAAKQLAILEPHTLISAENILALPMALGEMLFAFWLIYNGLKKSK